jgi:hypothetical protein
VDALIAELFAAEPHARPADGADAARAIERLMEALAMGVRGGTGRTATLAGVGEAPAALRSHHGIRSQARER